MKGNTLAIGAKAEPIRQPFSGAVELARVRTVEPDAKDLADLLSDHLHQQPVLIDQEGRRHERRQPLFRADLLQGTALEVVEPEVRRGLRVVFVERAAGTVAPR